MVSYQKSQLEIISQSESQLESSSISIPESRGLLLNPNRSNTACNYFKNKEITNAGNEVVVRSNSSSPTTKDGPLTSNYPYSLTQQEFGHNYDSHLNIPSQNIQPMLGSPAVSPTQKLSKFHSISEQNVSQSCTCVLYSHQHLHLPLQQQQHTEHISAEGNHQLQQMIQSQVSLGEMASAGYVPQQYQHQNYQLLDGQQQVEQYFAEQKQPTSFCQLQLQQNVPLVLFHQHNVQSKPQPVPEDEHQKRLQRNRDAARKCRDKKRVYVANLESKVTRLEGENAKLRHELSELRNCIRWVKN